ncbi:MAG: class II aldolase/adducin family protein [Acidimicrobiales bacterium]
MESAELSLRRQLIELCRSFGPRRLSQGSSGNASVRFPLDRPAQSASEAAGMLITPSALPYASMRPADIVWVGVDGTRRGKRPPSSEWRFHQAVFAARADVGAIVHVHSPAATALACLRLPIPPFHYMVAVAGGHDIRCAPYATFGTEELATAVVAALDGRGAALLANHGQIATGATLTAALDLAVEVETLAEQYLLARTVGEPKRLTARQMDQVQARFIDYRRGTLQ